MKGKMEETCNTYVEDKNLYRILTGKLGGNQSRRSPRRRWETSIKKYLKEDVSWIPVNTEVKIPAPYFSAMVVLHGVSNALSETSFRHVISWEANLQSQVLCVQQDLWYGYFGSHHIVT
jgi:hypothetical protein